jgi:hypothetical protein
MKELTRHGNYYKDRFQQFLVEFSEYEKEYLIRKKQDEFLDSYSRWIKTKSLKDKLTAIKKGIELEALDESFSLQKIFPLR